MKSSTVWLSRFAFVLILKGVFCQDEEQISQEKALCKDKSAGELFRLKSGKDACRDVIQCTAAVSTKFSSRKLNWTNFMFF